MAYCLVWFSSWWNGRIELFWRKKRREDQRWLRGILVWDESNYFHRRIDIHAVHLVFRRILCCLFDSRCCTRTRRRCIRWRFRFASNVRIHHSLSLSWDMWVNLSLINILLCNVRMFHFSSYIIILMQVFRFHSFRLGQQKARIQCIGWAWTGNTIEINDSHISIIRSAFLIQFNFVCLAFCN